MDGTTVTTTAGRQYTKQDVIEAVEKASTMPALRSEWKACWQCKLRLKLSLLVAATLNDPLLGFGEFGWVRIVDVPRCDCELSESHKLRWLDEPWSL
jgi:hypothetical protein